MRLAIILLMCGAAWGQMPTVQEICAAMEPANRAKTEACQPKPDTTSCIRGKTCPGLVIGQPEAPGYVEITESDGKMHRVCPKYQHLDPPIGIVDCGIDPSRNCKPHCVDDIHTVTEREWAELMARLNKLEHPYTAEELQHMRDILARLKALESRK